MSLHEFSWVIPGKLAGMAMPDGLPGDWLELRDRGVVGVVNLTRRKWPEADLDDADLAYLHLSVPDMHPPKPPQIRAFLEFCDDQISSAGGVAVHCLAGRGRTGTMLACYMVGQGMGAREAIEFVRERRPLSIETGSQESAVYALAARLRNEPGA